MKPQQIRVRENGVQAMGTWLEFDVGHIDRGDP